MLSEECYYASDDSVVLHAASVFDDCRHGHDNLSATRTQLSTSCFVASLVPSFRLTLPEIKHQNKLG